MGNVFSEKPFAEVVKEQQKQIKKAIRELDKEIRQQQNNEKKLKTEIKKIAKEGRMSDAKIKAKSLVSTRKFITRFETLKTQLNAASLNLMQVKSTVAMKSAMTGVAKALKTMNNKFQLPELQKIMTEFAKENEKADLTQEMMGDVLDDALGGADDEAEADEFVNQILDELGVTMTNDMTAIPTNDINKEKKDEQKADPSMDDLEARLNNLRNG